MTVQPFGSTSIVHPGRTATYTVWVWSAHADSKQVTVEASVRHVKGAGNARFSVCPSAQGSTCALGNLPQGQADELQVKVAVSKSATTGNNLTLNAKAQAKHAQSVSGSAAVKITAVPAPDPGTSPPGVGSDPGTGSLPVLPTVPADPVNNDPGGLFPTVSPHPSTSAGAAPSAGRARKIRATSAGDTLPLDPRLIGGQLAGLIVLAAAISIALARLSFRPQRPGAGDEPTDKE